MKTYFILISLISLYSCKSDQDATKERYLGEWRSVSGKDKISVYEENEGVFVNDGVRTFPIKFEPEGKYFSFPGVNRTVTILVKEDTLTVSGAIIAKYVKVGS
nr:hypothetical protein [uncultured Dyadobacter sp.]